MQRTGTNRRKRIIFLVVCILIFGVMIFLDQWTKHYFKNRVLNNGDITVIDGFFYFTYTVNKGAAWSFLSDKAWAQIFFKVLTVVAILAFILYFIYAFIKKKKYLQVVILLILAGTIGNFIDRLMYGGVTDFISFVFGSYSFPVFNLADCFLVVGVILLLINFLFIDEKAIFKKKNGNKESSDNN